MGIADHLREKGYKPQEFPSITLRPEILLGENIPQPMHGMAPRVVLGEKWWNLTRHEAYKAANYCCIACGVNKYATKRGYLEGHELYRIDYRLGRMTYLETVALCSLCHSYVHDGRLRVLFERGEIDQDAYYAVLEHGDRILVAAGLYKPSYAERERAAYEAELVGNVAEWSRWRLVIGKREFKPKFKSMEEWNKHFGH